MTESQSRLVCLGEVASRVSRHHTPKPEQVERWIGADHIDEGDLFVHRWSDTNDPLFPPTFKFRFENGAVLLHSRNPKKVAVASFGAITGEKLFAFSPRDPDELDSWYLAYQLQSANFESFVRQWLSGSVNKFLNWTALERFEFRLPPMDEQRRVVEILVAADRTASHYEALPRAIATQRDAAAAEIWRSTRDDRQLSGLAEVTVGIVVKPASLYVESGGVPTLRSLNVLPGRIQEDDLVQISPEGHLKHKKSQLNGGDVVVVRTGRPGDAAVIPDDGVSRNAIDLLIVRCGPELRSQYLTCFLNSAQGRSQMLGRSAGTAQQHLNAGQLNQVRIPVVRSEYQDQIVRLAEASQDVAAQVSATNARLASVRRSLRERLLQGMGA